MFLFLPWAQPKTARARTLVWGSKSGLSPLRAAGKHVATMPPKVMKVIIINIINNNNINIINIIIHYYDHYS